MPLMADKGPEQHHFSQNRISDQPVTKLDQYDLYGNDNNGGQ